MSHRLGLLADIHEEVDRLRAAIQALRECGVSKFVILGDVFETGQRIDETVAMLDELDSVGVWGNHDFGLCRDVEESVRQRYSPGVLKYFASLQPSIEVDGCRFQHIEPFLNPESLEDLWYYGSDGNLNASRSFASCGQRRVFMGHVHRWDLFTPTGGVAWDCPSMIRLDPAQRYFAAIHAVMAGWCAWYDPQDDCLCSIQLP